MKFLSVEKLSEHRYKTPEGYLVCVNSVLSRTGKQTYSRREVFGDTCDDPDTDVDIDREECEVFSEQALASFENKPLTIEHPDEDVNPENHHNYAVGFVRDVHKGVNEDGQQVMLGTLVINDASAIEAVENGLTDLSCGYDCDIINNCQKNIRGNHVALCKQGRAGIAHIVDSVRDASNLIKGIIYRSDRQISNDRFSDFIGDGTVKLDNGVYMTFWHSGDTHQSKERELPEHYDTESFATSVVAGKLDTYDFDHLSKYSRYKNDLIAKAKSYFRTYDSAKDSTDGIFYKGLVNGSYLITADPQKLKKYNPKQVYILQYDGKNFMDISNQKEKYRQNVLGDKEAVIDYKRMKPDVRIIDSPKVMAGAVLANGNYNWELEGRAKSKQEALQKFKAKFPECYEVWGEQLEWMADRNRDYEHDVGWGLHFDFDPINERSNHFYIAVVERKNRYEDSAEGEKTMSKVNFEYKTDDSAEECNCDHPYSECGPECECGCKDAWRVLDPRVTAKWLKKGSYIKLPNEPNNVYLIVGRDSGRIDIMNVADRTKSSIGEQAVVDLVMRDSAQRRYQVQYKDSQDVTHIHLVKATSLQEALKKVKL